MRIDSHVHGMHADCDESGKLRPPLRPIWEPGKMSPEDHVKGNMDRGIERVLLLDPPEITFRLKEIFGNFVIPCPQVDMDYTTPEDIDNLFKQGAIGIKFISPAKSYGDESYFPLYDVIRANKGLAVFHTGYLALEMYEPGGIMERKHYTDITYMRPATIDRVGRAFPDLKVLMAHFGNPWWEEAWKIIASHKNIYADFSGGTARRRSLAMWRQIFSLDDKFDPNSFGKVCFGTDGYAFIPGKYDSGPMIDFYEKLYDFLKVPNELREKVDRENMLMLIE